MVDDHMQKKRFILYKNPNMLYLFICNIFKQGRLYKPFLPSTLYDISMYNIHNENTIYTLKV